MKNKKLNDLFLTKEKEKSEIERYKSAIQSKLKDPEMAKKAAMIIENMIKESKKRDKAV